MRPAGPLTLALLAVACTNGPPAQEPGDGPRPPDPAATALQAALPTTWDEQSYLDVTVQGVGPRLRWRERSVAIEVAGRRPLLVVRDESYAADPAALRPDPMLVPPGEATLMWGVQLDCRTPGCIRVSRTARDEATVEEQRDSNLWLARSEAEAKALATALRTALTPPAGG